VNAIGQAYYEIKYKHVLRVNDASFDEGSSCRDFSKELNVA